MSTIASPFTMLGILTKSRRATTAANRVHATSRTAQETRKRSDSSATESGSNESSSRILDEEPSYTIIPKSDNRADIEQEWTDVGIDGKVKSSASKAEEERIAREAREKEEEAKRKAEERKKREEEDRRRAEARREEERRRAEEERSREEERNKREEEERRTREEERIREDERRAREEEERRRKDEEERKRNEQEEKKKREENERRMRENYESALRIREERAREAERIRQETIRSTERQKLEEHIRRQDEKEKTLQERLAVLENEQSAGAIQIRELMGHSEYLEDQNGLLKAQLQRQSDEVKDLKSQVCGPPKKITRFLSVGVAKTGKSIEQELVSLLDNLNSEVYQAAACLADLLESRSQNRTKAAVRTRASMDEARVAKMLGKEMTDVLKTKVDPLVIQVALQMCMNYCCVKIIQSWCPGMWNYSDFLSTLFTSIRATRE